MSHTRLGGQSEAPGGRGRTRQGAVEEVTTEDGESVYLVG